MSEIPEATEPNPEPKKPSFLSRIIRFDLIAVTALILSVISVFNDCTNSKRDAIRQDQINQLSYRPELKIVKTEPYKAFFRSDSFDLNNPPRDSNGILTMMGNVEVHFRFFITNWGNHKAKLKYQFYLDTTSGEHIIKKAIESRYLAGRATELPSDYYPDEEILPGDTIKDWHSFPIRFIKDSMFTIHVFLVYTNEIGQVFDTYYRERFIPHTVELPVTGVRVPMSQRLDEIIEAIDKKHSSKAYSTKEGEEMFRNIKYVTEGIE